MAEAKDHIVSDLLSVSHVVVEVPSIIEGMQHDTVIPGSVIRDAVRAATSVENEDVGP